MRSSLDMPPQDSQFSEMRVAGPILRRVQVRRQSPVRASDSAGSTASGPHLLQVPAQIAAPRVRSCGNATRRTAAVLSSMRSTADEARNSRTTSSMSSQDPLILSNSTSTELISSANTMRSHSSASSSDAEAEEESEDEEDGEDVTAAPSIRTTVAERPVDEQLGRVPNIESASQWNAYSSFSWYASTMQTSVDGSSDHDSNFRAAGSGRELDIEPLEQQEFLNALPMSTIVRESRVERPMGYSSAAPSQAEVERDQASDVDPTNALRMERYAPVDMNQGPMAQTRRVDISEYLWTDGESGNRILTVPVTGSDVDLQLYWTEITPQFTLDDFQCSSTAGSSRAGGQEASDSCIVCMDRSANATFIHGQTGHTACCLACALELQRRGETCPVCRLEFTAVIRNYMA